MNAPNIQTHIPVVAELPTESQEHLVGREDLPVPSLWQVAVKVKHKVTSQEAVVCRMDHAMNMFRAFYPNEGDIDDDGKPKGRFAPRTEWQHCRDWQVDVTFSPKELERQAAASEFRRQTEAMDPNELAAVMVLVDADDPAKALAKLEALRRLGVVKAAPSVVQAAVTEAKKGGK